MRCNWEDLPKPLSCFTTRNATMINLNTKRIIQHYSANTKIIVVQKCITSEGTYYRTASARHHYLNYAFKASAFGLPDEKAPSAPSATPGSLGSSSTKPASRTHLPVEKTKKTPKKAASKDGERLHRKLFDRIFRRKND